MTANLAAVLRQAREFVVSAIRANVGIYFDTAEHNLVKLIDAALAEYEAAATPSDYGPSAGSGQAELVRRLRLWAARDDIILSGPTCKEAAAVIEQLERENAALEGALRNSGNVVRDFQRLAKLYENELTRRAIPLPGEPRNEIESLADDLQKRGRDYGEWWPG